MCECLEGIACHEIVVPDLTSGHFCFIDGSDLAIGQEFENKEEVKLKLNDIALKDCFQIVIKKIHKIIISDEIH